MEAAVCGKAAIIADLHLGIEHALFARGIRGAEVSEKMTAKAVRLLEKTRKKKLIINGDLKERVVGVPPEARDFVEEVSTHAEIILVKGNHDGGMERAPGIEVVEAGGLAYNGVGIFHGHAWPSEEVMECKEILMGHNHPAVKTKSGWEPVWVRCEGNGNEILKKYPSCRGKRELILMPSFNPLLGTNIERMEGLGPALKKNLFKIDGAIAYTLGGAK
ncbi:MAG: metallophosphoesterase, partial [Candidatus Bilamarchaeaceae archaeon]